MSTIDNHRVGDRITLRTVQGQLRRGSVVAVDGADLHIEIDDGPMLIVATSEVKNISQSARESHQRRPNRGAGQKTAYGGRRKQLVSIRIETKTWNALERAVERGDIPSREAAVNDVLRKLAASLERHHMEAS